MSAADVSVCIVSWNTAHELRQCLESLLRTTTAVRTEIIVVDNASNDGTVAMLDAEFPTVHVIRNDENVGFARANNQAFRHATGRYLLLLNSDVIALPDALPTMIRFMDDHPEAGALGCRLLNADGSIQRSWWRGFPSLRSSVIEELYLWQFASFLQHEPTATASAIAVDHLLGACILVPRKTLERVGCLNEELFLFLEETEWCYRIRQSGQQIYFLPAAAMIHLGQRSVLQFPTHTLPIKYRNAVWFYRTHGRRTQAAVLALKLILALGAVLRTGLWTWRSWNKQGRIHARRMRAGYWAVLRQLPSF